jgi:hypothetical protein
MQVMERCMHDALANPRGCPRGSSHRHREPEQLRLLGQTRGLFVSGLAQVVGREPQEREPEPERALRAADGPLPGEDGLRPGQERCRRAVRLRHQHAAKRHDLDDYQSDCGDQQPVGYHHRDARHRRCCCWHRCAGARAVGLGHLLTTDWPAAIRSLRVEPHRGRSRPAATRALQELACVVARFRSGPLRRSRSRAGRRASGW